MKDIVGQSFAILVASQTLRARETNLALYPIPAFSAISINSLVDIGRLVSRNLSAQMMAKRCSKARMATVSYSESPRTRNNILSESLLTSSAFYED